MFLDVPTEILRQRFKGLQASPLPSNVISFTTTSSIDSLESEYAALQRAAESERMRILEQMKKRKDFEKGKDNVLHWAARRDDPGTLHCVLEFMRSEKLSLDFPNSERRTALEIAIQWGRVVVVKILLSAGAAVKGRNEKGQQPLHFAILELASAEICRLLMDSGANVNSALSTSEGSISPMHMTLELFLQSKKDVEKDAFCAILQELIDRGAQIKPDGGAGETSLEKFVQASTKLDSKSLSDRPKQTRPSSLVGYFLSADRNPLCWFPKQYCPAQECKSLAAYIFAHTAMSGLSEMLIESSDMTKYGLDLVHVLLKPCTMRYSNAEDLTVNDLLRNLLQKMSDQHVPGYLESGLLRHLSDRTPKKKRLERLDTLLRSRYVSRTECTDALIRLDDEPDEKFRLSLAELLLSQFDPAPDSPWAYQCFMDYFFDLSPSQIKGFAEDENSREEFKEHILTQLGVTPPTESAERIVQCVVHVYTKLLLEDNIPRHIDSADDIVYIASRLRELYGLPDIEVAKHLLLERPSIPPRPVKLLRGARSAPTSDYADSPETAMSDVLSYSHIQRIADTRATRKTREMYTPPDSNR